MKVQERSEYECIGVLITVAMVTKANSFDDQGQVLTKDNADVFKLIYYPSKAICKCWA